MRVRVMSSGLCIAERYQVMLLDCVCPASFHASVHVQHSFCRTCISSILMPLLYPRPEHACCAAARAELSQMFLSASLACEG